MLQHRRHSLKQVVESGSFIQIYVLYRNVLSPTKEKIENGYFRNFFLIESDVYWWCHYSPGTMVTRFHFVHNALNTVDVRAFVSPNG